MQYCTKLTISVTTSTLNYDKNFITDEFSWSVQALKCMVGVVLARY